MRKQTPSSIPARLLVDSQRFTPRPPSFLLRLGWSTFLCGMMGLLFNFYYPYLSICLFIIAVIASIIAFFQRHILGAATLFFATIFLSAFLFLIISEWRSFQAGYGFAKHNTSSKSISKNRL